MMNTTAPKNKYLYYESLSTNELENLIRLDFYADNPILEHEDLQAILQILEERKNSLQTDFDPTKSWLSFCDNYFFCVKQKMRLYDEDCKNKFSIRCKQNFRIVAITLIVFILSVSTFICVKTMKDPQWLSAFHYNTSKNLMDKNTIQQRYGLPPLPDHIVLNDIPKNLELVEDDFVEGVSFQRLKLCYKNPKTSEFLNYRLFHLSEEAIPQFEKDETPIEIYSKDNIDFYIMKNIEEFVVLWKIDNFECQLSGTISREEFMKIIDSI